MSAYLLKLLIEEEYLKIVDKARKYRVNVVATIIITLRLLMTKTVANTRDTASHMRKNVTSLEAHIAIINSRINLFNLRANNSELTEKE